MSDGFVPAVAWSRADFDIAEHEAAHAVIASFYGVPVKEVRIDHPDDVHGVCVIDHSSISDEELRTRARDHVSILLAGPLASGDQVEWPLYGPPGSDHARAATTIRISGMSEADFNQIKGITKGLLRLYQRQVRGLASALLDRGAITGSEIAEVVKHYMKRQVS